MNLERLSQAKEFSAIVVSGSLLLGVSWLVGKCWIIGFDSFAYLTATDIARNAMLISPVFMLLTAIMLIWNSAFEIQIKKTPKEIDTASFHQKVLQLDVIFLPIILVGGYLFFSPLKFYFYIIFWAMAVVGTSLDFVFQLRKMQRVSALTHELCMLLGIAFIVAIVALSLTGTAIHDLDAKPTERICIKDICRDGTVITRFTEATYLRWEGEKQLVVIENSEITSVMSNKELAVDPLIDLRPAFWRTWRGLITLLGC